MELLRESTPKAKKDYSCDACEYILNAGINGNGWEISEIRQIIKAKRKGYKILKGEVYIYQVGKYEGDLCCFRAIPEMHELCLQYDLYDSD